MNLVTAEHLTKSYTERLLFDDTDFSINEGDKIGLIGINGTGKSTLLKLVAGLEEPDSGRIVRGRNLDIRYLPQNPVFHPGETVLESVLRENEGHEHVWDIESQAKSMLNRLGIPDFNEKVEHLSGGQKKRAALASVLLSTAELLILDEPTNHLDSEMADWLEDYLKKFKGALLMITHDRYFLDSVTNRIVELDKGKLYSYQANYEGFLELKAERMDMEKASERKRQSILRTELAWMQRGARARSTKQKGRIQRFETLRDKKGPVEDGKVEMESISSRLGRTTIEISDLCKSYGDKVLVKDYTYFFLKDDRIGYIGPNGSGKSTLMNLLSKSDVFAENKLFATLDTTVRKIAIKNVPFLLADTVGFIRKLPHHLVESFKSTLDEVREADVILHVVDISHPQFEDQMKVVNATLAELIKEPKPTIIIFNKIDAFHYVQKEEDDLTPVTRENYSLNDLKQMWMSRQGSETVYISAVKKENIEELKEKLYDIVKEIHSARFPYNDFLYQDYTENNPETEE